MPNLSFSILSSPLALRTGFYSHHSHERDQWPLCWQHQQSPLSLYLPWLLSSTWHRGLLPYFETLPTFDFQESTFSTFSSYFTTYCQFNSPLLNSSCSFHTFQSWSTQSSVFRLLNFSSCTHSHDDLLQSMALNTICILIMPKFIFPILTSFLNLWSQITNYVFNISTWMSD